MLSYMVSVVVIYVVEKDLFYSAVSLSQSVRRKQVLSFTETRDAVHSSVPQKGLSKSAPSFSMHTANLRATRMFP
jgi:hypothetical protein